MSANSTISVIIPTYNRAALLQEAINSLLKQTRVPDEIIVIDDGSTDNTLDILAQYGTIINVLSQPNRGLPAARNAGLRRATGDLIVFLDSDDILPPSSHARFAHCLETSPEIALAYSNANLIDLGGNDLGLFSNYRPGPRPSGMILNELALHNLFPPHAAMVRSSHVNGIFFDESLKSCEDYDFWLRIAAKHLVAYIDEPLATYRLHNISMSQSNPQRMRETEIEVQSRVFAMPQFKQLTRRQQARIYCSHGIKNAMIGKIEIARQSFFKAIKVAPTAPTGYVLALSSLLGERWLRFVIMARRQAVGNRSLQNVLKSAHNGSQ